MNYRKEYHTRDKVNWGQGAWRNEPDKVEWRDAATDLPCLIVRGPVGALCGYVGIPAGHPWHRQDYDAIAADVHGGLTFASAAQPGDPAQTVSYSSDDGEDLWFVGFDCAHWLDLAPAVEGIMRSPGPFPSSYRDIAYVEAEVRKLAAQAAATA